MSPVAGHPNESAAQWKWSCHTRTPGPGSAGPFCRKCRQEIDPPLCKIEGEPACHHECYEPATYALLPSASYCLPQAWYPQGAPGGALQTFQRSIPTTSITNFSTWPLTFSTVRQASTTTCP